MITDNQLSDEVLSSTWNSFFHFFLDKKSLSFLIVHCKSLIEASESITTWNKSKYAKFIRMSNVNTLLDLRRHWELYVQADKLSPSGKKQLKEKVLSRIDTIKSTMHKKSYLFPCRSAGPYFHRSIKPATEVFHHYWKSGITSLDPHIVSAATFINPTFVYSLTGEGFALHYGTTPISPFHLAPAFSANKNTPGMRELVDCAKSQFFSWLKHFRTFVQGRLGKLTIRIFAGDALFLCRAFAHHAGTGRTPANLTVAPWNPTPLALDGGYHCLSESAPTSFNIIETSNIMDHIGLLNVLIATLPLLSPDPSATLFTEALLITEEDATKNFTAQSCADVSTISLLLDLSPINYFSNFNTRSNAEEILAARTHISNFRQYHERITWKRPMTGDQIIASQLHPPVRILISFEPQNLGRLLFDIYLKMFTSDDTMSRLSNLLRSPGSQEIVHYIRETFAIFLAIVKRRVNVDWDSTMASFFDKLDNDRALMMGMSNYQDLCAHLHLAGVHTAEFMRPTPLREGRFRKWTHVPPTVSVILAVPRDDLRVLSDMDPDTVGTPVLHGNLHGQMTHNIFASLKVGFGKISPSGTDAHPEVVFEPDPSSWSGTSPLIVSFSVPSCALHIERPDDMTVTLSLRSTPQTSFIFMSKLGVFLNIFSAPLMDHSKVFVVPDEPRGFDDSLNKIFVADNRQGYKVSATTDSQCRRVTTLTTRIDITDVPTKNLLSRGEEISSRQTSPHVMEVKIGQRRSPLIFPLPVIGSRSKLRIARKSFYVEVFHSFPFVLGLASQSTG